MKTETKIDPRARQFHSDNFNIFMRRCLNRWALVADIFYNVKDERKMAEVWFGDKNAYGKGYTAFLKISDGVYLKTQGATKMEAAIKMGNVLATSTISVSVA
jgi:hypothetical protein